MRRLLCGICKGGKLLCGAKFCPILHRMRQWRQAIQAVKRFTGTSPPAIFVGRAFYPRVYVGILSPPGLGESAILDSPELWYRQRATIDQILSWRGQLIYSRYRSHVRRPSGRLVGVTQELAMARRPTDVEIELKKRPQFRFSFDPWVTPIGNPAPIAKARLAENVSVERRVDRLTADYDVKARHAVLELYRYGLPVSRIQKMFSAGLLGLKIERRLVPTRWSITGCDDIIGRALCEKIRTYPQLGEIRLFHNTYIGNHYEVLLVPGAYQYELVEIKHPRSVWNIWGKQPLIYADYEPYWGRKSYADRTGGAFYSGRLAVVERLAQLKRQATVLIVREVTSEFWAPTGIWQLREAVRDALAGPFEKFDSLELAIDRMCARLAVGGGWIGQSRLVRILRTQLRLNRFTRLARSLSRSPACPSESGVRSHTGR